MDKFNAVGVHRMNHPGVVIGLGPNQPSPANQIEKNISIKPRTPP
jgi:hypothetical protein